MKKEKLREILGGGKSFETTNENIWNNSEAHQENRIN